MAPARLVEGSPQSTSAALATVPLEEGSEGEGIGELSSIRLVERPEQGIVVEDGGEVEERPGPGCDRDPVEDGALVGGEHGAVDLNQPGSSPP